MNEEKFKRLDELLLQIEQEVPKYDLSDSEEQYIDILNSLKEDNSVMYHIYLDRWVNLDYKRFKKLNSTYGKIGNAKGTSVT